MGHDKTGKMLEAFSGDEDWTMARWSVAGYRGSNASRLSELTETVAISVALDLILSALPTYCLWKIQMSLRTKVAICAIMSLGVL